MKKFTNKEISEGLNGFINDTNWGREPTAKDVEVADHVQDQIHDSQEGLLYRAKQANLAKKAKKMTQEQKVKAFIECIRSTDSAYSARMLAFRKHNLNASAVEDEASWWEAVERCGSPYSTPKGEK